jgi:hypothetical protein
MASRPHMGSQESDETEVSFKIDVRFQVLTAASMMFRIVFWDVLPDDGGSMHL